MTDTTKTLVKNSVLFTIAPFLPKVINVFLMPIMTMYLTDVDFGISGTISSYSQAISAFATLGLGVVLMNSFYKNPLEYKTLWRQIYGFLKLWMIVYALLQAILLYFIIPGEALENRWWIIILTNFSTVFFGPTATIGSNYYLYKKEAFPVVWRSVLASIITVAVDFVLIVYLRWGYMGWYVGSFAGVFFSNASYWYVVNYRLGLKPNYHFNWAEIKHALSVGAPTIPHFYTPYLLEGSGRMVLDRYHVSQGEIGRVSITQQVGGIFSMGMIGLNQAITPYFMQAIKDKREDTVKELGIVYVLLCFCAAFIVSVWSKEIFDVLISNDSLKSAYPLLIAYVMALCYRPMYVIASNYYFFHERTKQLLLITFVSGALALLLYIALTPFIGIWGFLVGHYVACLYYGYSGYFYSCYRENAHMHFPFVLIFIIQIVLTGIAYILVDMLWIKIIVTLLTGIIMCWVAYKNKHYFKRGIKEK